MDGPKERRYLINSQPRGKVAMPPRPNKSLAPDEHINQLTGPKSLNFPYNQQHQPTSNPKPNSTTPPEANLINNVKNRNSNLLEADINHKAEQAAAALVNKINTEHAKKSREKYHTAWQNYYQKYYEHYYIAALEEQKKRFSQRQAGVVDSRENDGKLEQSEVQERLTKEIINKAHTKTKPIHKSNWFLPVVCGLSVIILLLVLQYNSVISAKIANFISPGNLNDQTIIIGAGHDQAIDNQSRIIIPKINVNAPVVYNLTNLDEGSSQKALQQGVIHYPVAGATAVPGQQGNTVLLGHSSADFFAPGNYKFVFVQLNRLKQDDLFYLDYNNTRYTYKVIRTKVINPDQIRELNIGTNKPYATLVTCDPPGTISRRLLIIAEQVSPNPNSSQTIQSNSPVAKQIPGKPKTILENIFGR